MRTHTIPKGFYDDHTVGRDLPAPPIIKKTSRHYQIDGDHPDMAELVADAEFYADPWGPDQAPHVVLAAIAMLRALKRGV
jgi:hypothetical protein